MRWILDEIDFFSDGARDVALGTARPVTPPGSWPGIGRKTGEFAADGAAEGAAEEMLGAIEGSLRPSWIFLSLCCRGGSIIVTGAVKV